MSKAKHDEPEAPLAVGDTVCPQIAGAPPMTIMAILPNGTEARCCWFCPSAEWHEQVFNLDLLKRA